MHYLIINFLKLLRSSTLLFLLLALSQIAHAQHREQEIAKIAKEVGSPGIQVAYQKGKQLELFAKGVKKYGTEDLVNQNTRFQAASLTKVVAAYAFFRLMDKGIIELDKPLMHYYTYDRLSHTPHGDKITARMVLTHRSGLLNWEGDVPSSAWRSTPLTLQFEPGEDYMYSGEGFYFLQETLEFITKKSFQQLAEEEVIIPLGLTHTNFVWNDTLSVDAAYGHYTMEQPRRLGKYAKTNAAYTLYTTASDYIQFVQQALIKGKGLKNNTRQLMLTKVAEAKKAAQPSPDDKYVPCALGMRMQINEKGIAYWHTGSNPGFRCFFITYPARKESLVAFMNTDTGFPAMEKLMKLFLDKNQTFWAYDWRQGELD